MATRRGPKGAWDASVDAEYGDAESPAKPLKPRVSGAVSADPASSSLGLRLLLLLVVLGSVVLWAYVLRLGPGGLGGLHVVGGRAVNVAAGGVGGEGGEDGNGRVAADGHPHLHSADLAAGLNSLHNDPAIAPFARSAAAQAARGGGGGGGGGKWGGDVVVSRRDRVIGSVSAADDVNALGEVVEEDLDDVPPSSEEAAAAEEAKWNGLTRAFPGQTTLAESQAAAASAAMAEASGNGQGGSGRRKVGRRHAVRVQEDFHVDEEDSNWQLAMVTEPSECRLAYLGDPETVKFLPAPAAPAIGGDEEACRGKSGDNRAWAGGRSGSYEEFCSVVGNELVVDTSVCPSGAVYSVGGAGGAGSAGGVGVAELQWQPMEGSRALLATEGGGGEKATDFVYVKCTASGSVNLLVRPTTRPREARIAAAALQKGKTPSVTGGKAFPRVPSTSHRAPLNVLVLVVASLSRRHFFRALPKTAAVLQRQAARERGDKKPSASSAGKKHEVRAGT
jgi:hypothetical protein